LNSSPQLIPVIKFMRMSWVGHRAQTRETGYMEVYSRAIRLYYAANNQICKLYIYYRSFAKIQAVRYTIYFIF